MFLLLLPILSIYHPQILRFTHTHNAESKFYSPMCNQVDSSDETPVAATSSIQIMRVANASGGYEDVVLRPKTAAQKHRLARSLAAISGFFKSSRVSETNRTKTNEHSPIASHTPTAKRKTWNFFKLKEKQEAHSDAMPSFQHFQEPLNIERPSLARGDINLYGDAEWYDLNKDEMNLFEARLSTVVHEFNRYNKIGGQRAGCGSGDGESSNALWSQNYLSTSYKSERENRKAPMANHCQRMQSICCCSKESAKPVILIDDIMTKSIDCHCHCDSDESCKLSSGFGSDGSDTNSPQEFARRLEAFTNSPTTSDFFETAFCQPIHSNVSNECIAAATAVASINLATATSPITPKTMQKTSKKYHIHINFGRLFGMLYGKRTSSRASVNVTLQHKSATVGRSKKVHNGTPFKRHPMKQKRMYVTEVESQ